MHFASTPDLEVFTHGSNEMQQLGLAPLNVSFRRKPTAIVRLDNLEVCDVDSGTFHNTILNRLGKVYTWGLSDLGQLGREISETDLPGLPSPISLPVRITSISCGDTHVAALDEHGFCWIWGCYYSESGYKGFPLPESRRVDYCGTPTQVEKLSCITKISSGSNHTVAVVKQNEVWVWGCNDVGQMGIAVFDEINSGLSKDQINAKHDEYLRPHRIETSQAQLALMNKGINISKTTVDAWGTSKNTYIAYDGRILLGCGVNCRANVEDSTRYLIDCMIPVAHLADKLKKCEKISMIVGGSECIALLTSFGRVITWGRSDYCGRPVDTSVPHVLADPINLPFVRSISSGADHFIANTINWQAYAWGVGMSFQLGTHPGPNAGPDELTPAIGLDHQEPVLITSRQFDSRLIYKSSGGSLHSVHLALSPNKRLSIPSYIPPKRHYTPEELEGLNEISMVMMDTTNIKPAAPTRRGRPAKVKPVDREDINERHTPETPNIMRSGKRAKNVKSINNSVEQPTDQTEITNLEIVEPNLIGTKFAKQPKTTKIVKVDTKIVEPSTVEIEQTEPVIAEVESINIVSGEKALPGPALAQKKRGRKTAN